MQQQQPMKAIKTTEVENNDHTTRTTGMKQLAKSMEKWYYQTNNKMMMYNNWNHHSIVLFLFLFPLTFFIHLTVKYNVKSLKECVRIYNIDKQIVSWTNDRPLCSHQVNHLELHIIYEHKLILCKPIWF